MQFDKIQKTHLLPFVSYNFEEKRKRKLHDYQLPYLSSLVKFLWTSMHTAYQ